jgi:hypothetical protein
MKIKNFGDPWDAMIPRESYYALSNLFFCDPLQKLFYAGESNNKSCDKSYACCPEPSEKSQDWQCVTHCTP